MTDSGQSDTTQYDEYMGRGQNTVQGTANASGRGLMFGTRSAHQRAARVGPRLSEDEQISLAQLDSGPIRVSEALPEAIAIVHRHRDWLGIDPELTALADRIGQALLTPNDTIRFRNYGSYTPWGLVKDDDNSPSRKQPGKTTAAIVESSRASFPEYLDGPTTLAAITEEIGPRFRRHLQTQDRPPVPQDWSSFVRPACLAVINDHLATALADHDIRPILATNQQDAVSGYWRSLSREQQEHFEQEGVKMSAEWRVPAAWLVAAGQQYGQQWFESPEQRRRLFREELQTVIEEHFDS